MNRRTFTAPAELGARLQKYPTDENLIGVVSTLYEAVGDDVDVFAQGIGVDREEAEEVITTIRECREEGLG